jgi:hypothetical protein
MNGFELAGRSIRVGLGNDKFTPESKCRRFTCEKRKISVDVSLNAKSHD